MAIIFVSGINDPGTIGVGIDGDGNLLHLMDGNCSVHGKVPLKEDIVGYVVLFGKGVKQRMISFAESPSLIFNQIADADTHRGALERCEELCANVSCPVINKPQDVLQTTRDGISGLLQGINGVIMPKTVRFRPASPRSR